MKSQLRTAYRALRSGLSLERRLEAQERLLRELLSVVPPFERIASFTPFGSEIDLSPFNEILAQEHRLLLPRVEGSELIFYAVSDLNTLVPALSGIREPDPSLHSPVLLTPSDLILVPALAFDQENFRLGMGKGHYDRWFARHSAVVSIGIGFQEQLHDSLLPRDPWDRAVQSVLLF